MQKKADDEMEFSPFKDFNRVKLVNKEQIDKFSDIVPIEMIEIWKEFGFGSFMNGYLKVVNPDDYFSLIKHSYTNGDRAVPLFSTAFGDVIIWENNEFLKIIMYRYGSVDVMLKGMKYFLPLLATDPDEFINDFFTIEKYNEAISQYGQLEYDECFGYVPLLALGGEESTDKIKKVKLREHIALITELVGGV